MQFAQKAIRENTHYGRTAARAGGGGEMMTSYRIEQRADLNTTNDTVDFLSRRRLRASSLLARRGDWRTAPMDDLRIGSWVVAPSLNSISFGGRTVRLEPKVMGVLLCLAKHPGETVSKEQLFHAIWPDIVVTEDVLKRCIAELRRAFDDNAREPRVIETISKRGYRLVAPVTARSASPAPAETAV